MDDHVKEMSDLLIMIARCLVAAPEQVTCSAVQRDGYIALRPHVAKSDVGNLVGHMGITGRAIKILIHGISASKGYQLRVELPIPTAPPTASSQSPR